MALGVDEQVEAVTVLGVGAFSAQTPQRRVVATWAHWGLDAQRGAGELVVEAEVGEAVFDREEAD